MLIPIADVPRWYAERKPKDTIAVSHGADAITWEQLERNANARARAFAAKGVKPGDFVAIGLPNSNVFFRDHFCGVDVRRDADVVDLAAAARRSRRRARYPQAVAGGRWPARLERPQLAARRFRA
jgi:acyl-CoA synthetase (AMP-forming)/AMP-acid ligase II